MEELSLEEGQVRGGNMSNSFAAVYSSALCLCKSPKASDAQFSCYEIERWIFYWAPPCYSSPHHSRKCRSKINHM